MFSYFHSPISNIRPNGELSLFFVHQLIISDKWAQTTRYLRSLEPNHQKQVKCKKLNFVTFSGTFTQRKSQNLIRHSNLLCFDFDHIGDELKLSTIRQQLIADLALNVQLLFRSPSGDGLKVVVRADVYHEGMSHSEVLAKHNREYQRLMEYISRTHSLQADATSDVARACFLCHDPQAYINSQLKNAETMTARYSPPNLGGRAQRAEAVCKVGTQCAVSYDPEDQKKYSSHCNYSDYSRIEQMVQRLERERRDVTTAYRDWYRIGAALANEFGESGRSLYHRISCYYPCYTQKETDEQYTRCLKYRQHCIRLGTLFYLLRK